MLAPIHPIRREGMKIIVIIAILFCFGCESSTNPSPVNTKPAQAKPTETVNKTDKLAAPKDYKKYNIKEWSGSGIKSTETFSIPPYIPGNWTISWGTAPINKFGGVFQIYVYKTDGTLVDIVANVTEKNIDSTVMRSGPGNYYLKINSANMRYSISVWTILEK